MAWYRNYYACARCSHDWPDEWSCMCDDDCPDCGARHMSPYESDNLTTVVERENGQFVVLWSPETAEHQPDYRELGRFVPAPKQRHSSPLDEPHAGPPAPTVAHLAPEVAFLTADTPHLAIFSSSGNAA
jgi:LmbE family N-acetylglucosaminyl deacetylase